MDRSRKQGRPRWGTLIALAFMALAACDKSGLHPLGRDRDVIVPCDEASTWLRSVEDGTEGLVLGAQDLGSLEARLAEGPVCFHTFYVAHDSTTRLSSGALERTAEGALIARVGHDYSFDYNPERSLLTRKGTARDDWTPPVAVPVELTPDGDTLLFERAGEAARLTRLGAVVARLDPSLDDPGAPGGAEDVYRLFNLSLFTSQVRVPSFGSAGMTTYADNPTLFRALVGGEFEVEIDSFLSPTAFIDYRDYQDLGGVVVSGLQVSRVDTRGNGPMEGVLDVAFYTAPGGPASGAAPHLEATIDYSALVVRDGVAGDGHYVVTYAGRAAELEYTIATDEDLRGILPVREGLP